MRTTGYAVDEDGSKERKKESHRRQALPLLLSHISFFFLNRIKRKKRLTTYII
jgi:hypothetical protein